MNIINYSDLCISMGFQMNITDSDIVPQQMNILLPHINISFATETTTRKLKLPLNVYSVEFFKTDSITVHEVFTDDSIVFISIIIIYYMSCFILDD